MKMALSRNSCAGAFAIEPRQEAAVAVKGIRVFVDDSFSVGAVAAGSGVSVRRWSGDEGVRGRARQASFRREVQNPGRVGSYCGKAENRALGGNASDDRAWAIDDPIIARLASLIVRKASRRGLFRDRDRRRPFIERMNS